MGLGSMTAKDAKLTLKLEADSGYSAEETHRISAYEWGDILAICAGTERGQKLAAGPDLYAALEHLTELFVDLAPLGGDTAREVAVVNARAALAKSSSRGGG